MDTIKLWARNGDAVRQAIELGERVHLDTASEEGTDALLLFAMQSGLLSKRSEALPDPRCKPEIRMDVMVPLKAPMLSYNEAVQLAELQDAWQPHPSRDEQHMACVTGMEHMWEGGPVALNACVMRSWNRNKKTVNPIVLVTTEQRLPGPWIVRHDEERPEIEPDYQPMKSAGWQLKKLSSTRYSAIVFSILTVVLSYSLSHLFANTKAGVRFADKTPQARALAQLRSRKTPIIV